MRTLAFIFGFLLLSLVMTYANRVQECAASGTGLITCMDRILR